MDAALDNATVFVLGAGFTHAFVPSAPLLVDDYGLSEMVEAFEHFPHASRVLASSVLPDGRVNIEQLLTRLDGLLPYDFERGATPELSLLLTTLVDRFRARVSLARAGERNDDGLAHVARFCVDRAVTCITFNYDDVFDEALWKCEEILDMDVEDPSVAYWHPDGGYGFFCKPSKTLIREPGFGGNVAMDTTCMLLLKLHGSINWMIRRGYSRPLAVDAIVHDEEWLPSNAANVAAVRDHLERDPFIVPPVLVKGSLMQEPILRMVWSRAFETLQSAHHVVFLGYSMPPTDIAAQYLFKEAIRADATITVVDYTPDGSRNQVLIDSYKLVSPAIPEDAFRFSGIVRWASELPLPERAASQPPAASAS